MIKISLARTLMVATCFLAGAGVGPTDSALAQDGDTARAQELLDAWAEALGGREALAAVESTHFRGRAEMMGLDGTFEQWVGVDGRRRVELALADVFSVVLVQSGGETWFRDQNGKVSRMEGEELASETTSLYLETFSHLLPGRLPGAVEHLGAEAETGLHVLRLAPEGGLPVTFYLDPKTHLPVRSERPLGDRVSTARYADWRTIDGVRFPAEERGSEGGEAKYDSRFAMEQIEVNPHLTLGLFAKPEDRADDVKFAFGGDRVEVPIELSGVHIFLQIRVADSDPLWFLLDTGAAITVLNSPTAEKLGLSMKGTLEGRGAGEGSIEVNLIPGVTLRLPGLSVEEQTVAAISFDDIEALKGRPIDGIVGYDFISRFVVEIDYGERRLRLHRRDRFQYEGDGVTVPITLDGNVPYVTARVIPHGGSPIEGSFLLDTGAGAAVGFARPFTQQHDLLATLPAQHAFRGGLGVGGASNMVIGRIGEFELGGFSFPELLCTFSQDEAGVGADPNHAGLIGGEVLQQFTLIFDYDAGKMIMEPNPEYGTPLRRNLAGLKFTTGGRGHWDEKQVHTILPGSPADAAGLRVGDVLVSVDGTPAADIDLDTLSDLFREEGRTLPMAIQREGEPFQVELSLEPWI